MLLLHLLVRYKTPRYQAIQVFFLTHEIEHHKLTQEEQDEEDENNLIQSSHVVQVKLADQQADPNSPLYSVKSFDQLGLSPELLKGLYAMKFSKPSKIQERALPLLIGSP
jgi:ATP-dependent RNA helicase DDX19/DBP5